MCVPSGPPCEAAWRTDAIFLAQVVSIATKPGPTYSPRTVSMRILEAFRGIEGESVEVTTGAGAGDCGYDFEAGRDYLVYAYRNGHRLATGICNRTRPVEEAEEDLDYLRAVAWDLPVGGAIVGEVRHREPWSETGPTIDEPRSGVRVTIAGEGQTRETVSDHRGLFVVVGLTPGAYNVAAEAPDGFHVTVLPGNGPVIPGRVVLTDPRACASVDVGLRYDGRISGRILNADGSPASYVFVQAIRVEEADRPGVHDSRFQTDESGHFEIARLPEGRFLVGLHVKRSMEGNGLPRVMLPGTDSVADARVFSLIGGERIVVPDLTLPEALSFVTLRGVVIGGDGRPAAEALVYLHMPDRRGVMLGASMPVSDTGEFAFAVLPGERYEVQATLRGATPGPPQHVEAEFAVAPGSEPPMLRLVFK